MAKNITENPAPRKAATVAGESDLSKEIMRTIEREPRDQVRCVRVFDDFYRCNWWAPSSLGPDQNRAFDWSTATTHHVRKSRFISASISAGQLLIKEVVSPGFE